MTTKPFPRDLEKVIRFHGHFCGGITIGYRAARVGLSRLHARRSEDEELIAIVENDSCAADAVQVITGCTFGKGNFFFRDYGKHVYTLALRPSGRAVRVSQKPNGHPPAADMLDAPVDDLFWIEETTIALPDPAQIHDSVVCDRCAEPVMATRTRRRGDRVLCIPCAMRRRSEDDEPPAKPTRHDEDAAES
jgi:formylmethanofuran dehydrogenase subunit E